MKAKKSTCQKNKKKLVHAIYVLMLEECGKLSIIRNSIKITHHKVQHNQSATVDHQL